MKNLIMVFGILGMGYPIFASAAHTAHQAPRLEFTALLGGSYIPNTIDDQTLALLPYEVGPYADTFTDQSGDGTFTWGVDAKYRFKLHAPSTHHYIVDSIGAGVDVYQITQFEQTGKVLQFGMAEFENYTYALKLKNTRFMADFDLDFHPIGEYFIPFIEAGIGAAVTSISYKSDPIYPIDSPDFTLPNKTSWNFAYQVGAGMKFQVNDTFLLSFHYLYANMGKVDSSTKGNSATLASPLTADMSTQNFLMGFTYAL